METTDIASTAAPAISPYSLPDWYTWVIALSVPAWVGSVGNIFVLVSYAKYPELRGPTNLLIANQGLADLLSCLMSIPYVLMNYTVPGLTLIATHKYFCLFFLCSVTMALWSSLLNVLLLSIDRLIFIQFPYFYSRVIDEKFIKKTLLVKWVILIIIPSSIPLFGIDTWSPTQRCSAQTSLPPMFTVYFSILCFLVLMMVLFICLIICCITVSKRKTMPTGPEDQQQKSQYKLTKMMLTFVGIFYLCWLPFALLSTLLILCRSACFPKGVSLETWITLEFSRVLLIYKSTFNPLIYCWKSKAYRSAFSKMIGKLPNDTGIAIVG